MVRLHSKGLKDIINIHILSMPLKAIKKAKTYKVVKKAPKRNTRLKRGVPRSLIFYDNSRLNPYPQKFITKMHTSLYGFVPSGALASSNYQILANSCVQPFGLSTTLFPNPSAPVANLNPTGFEALCNANLYSRYRVTGFKVTLEYIPQALTDTVIATLTPSCLAGSCPNVATAMTQPFTRKGNFNSSKNNTNQKGNNAITLSMRCHEFIGVNKMIFDNDLSGSFTAPYNAAAGRSIFVIVNWATPDAVAIATALQYRIDLTQYVELYEPTNANMVQ